MIRAVVTATLLSTLAIASASVQQVVEDTVLAVVTYSHLLPIARLSADGWVDTWPGSEEEEVPVPALNDIPTAWLGRRVPTEWTVWFTAGGSTRVLINGTQRYGGCQSPPALTMTRPQAVPSGAFDDIHLGIATNTAQIVHSLRALPPNSRPVRARAAIATAAKQVVGRDHGISSMYESGAGQNTVYYYETREAKLPGRDWPSLVRGWLRRNAQGTLRGVGAEIHACGYDGPVARPHSCLIPLGVLRQPDHELWVMERPQGETHAFELWKITPATAERILVADAGGC